MLALTRIDPKRQKKRIHALASRIAKAQRASGLWDYALGEPPAGVAGKGDHSNTQFAVLALWAAQEGTKFKVPKEVWARVRDHFAKSQLRDGTVGLPAGGRSPGYGRGHEGPDRHDGGGSRVVRLCGGGREGARGWKKARGMDVAVKGLEAFTKAPVPYGDPYAVYAAERVGTVLDRPPAAWFRRGREGRAGAPRPAGQLDGPRDPRRQPQPLLHVPRAALPLAGDAERRSDHREVATRPCARAIGRSR